MDRLRIGVDGYNLAMPNGTGVATYGLTLAQTLQEAGHRVEGVFGVDTGRDPRLREVLFFDRIGQERAKPSAYQRRRLWLSALRPSITAHAEEVANGRVAVEAFAARLPAFDRLVSSPRLFELAHRHFAVHGRFVRLCMPDPPPIMHWTYPVPIVLEGARNIYTFHDIVPLKLPYTTLNNKTQYRSILQGCIDRAARICTVSETSRSDIVAEFAIDPAKVVNTYQVTPRTERSDLAASDQSAMIKGVFGLEPGGYFLYFGAIEPKKNVGRLLEAYLALGSETALVLVSGRGWQSDQELLPLRSAAENSQQRSSRVIRLDHLSRHMLSALIANARAVTFPSIYEGFGLPVLEAMQVGTPVLTSNVSSLPEVAGDAALLVDPYDVGAIIAGLRRLDEDADLRHRLAVAGPDRASLFSRSRYLERLEDLYAKALS